MPMVFVYGPDSLQGRIYDRVGPSNVIGGAMLDGYRLVFNKPNMKNPKEGFANIEESSDAKMFGVVYDLSRKQIDTLEGYYGGYGRIDVNVKLLTEEGNMEKAIAWAAHRTKSGLLPSEPALDQTRKGADENSAPEEVVEALAALKAL